MCLFYFRMSEPSSPKNDYVSFTWVKYERVLNLVHPERGAVPQEPQHWYRGPVSKLATDLARLAGPLEFRRVPTARDDGARLVGGMVPVALDELARALQRVETYEDAKLFFQKHCCYARHLIDAIFFMRRVVGHVLACVNTSYYVLAKRELQKAGPTRFMPTIIDNVTGDVPPFIWRVFCDDKTYGVRFDEKIAHDPVYGYETVVAAIENPIARGYRPMQMSSGTLNLGGKMVHAHALRAKFAAGELDPQYAVAYEDPGAHRVFMHVVRLMAAPETAPADVRAVHHKAGLHLLYTLAWCIQNPGMRSTLVLTIFSMIQQCGKSTILPLLRALLGAKLVVSLPANQLQDRFLAFLRGALFLFLDEGADAVGEKTIDLLKMLVGLDVFTSQEKGQAMASVTNVITILATANRWYVTMQPDDRHVRPYFPPGVLQDDYEYFRLLYADFASPATMERAFLLFSRVPLYVNVDREFRVSSLCELARRTTENMSNRHMISVYRRMDDLLDRCTFASIPTGTFMEQMTAVVAQSFAPSEVPTVTRRIFDDLVLRGVLTVDHTRHLIRSNIKKAVSCEANDLPTTLGPPSGKRPRDPEQ